MNPDETSSGEADLSPPYPADTRAKGWRFELDYEQIEQSDTWALAAEVPMARHALMMMWLKAWTQVPCGTLPADDAVLRSRLEISAADWDRLRPVLMRGWWLASDGRLYHKTLTKRVLEMLDYRRKESDRRIRNRHKPPDVPELSRGTIPGQAEGGTGTPDTGTGTGTGTLGIPTLVAKDSNQRAQTARADFQKKTGEAGARVRAGVDAMGDDVALCLLAETLASQMRDAGVADADYRDPKLRELLRQGYTTEEMLAAARYAKSKRKGMTYALSRAEGRRADAVAAAGSAGPGGDGAAVAAADPESRAAVEAAGVAIGVGLWQRDRMMPGGEFETFAAYKTRVRAAQAAQAMAAPSAGVLRRGAA